MNTVTKRYILNRAHKVAHDRTRLTERCESELIVAKRFSDYIPAGYNRCVWCLPDETAAERCSQQLMAPYAKTYICELEKGHDGKHKGQQIDVDRALRVAEREW